MERALAAKDVSIFIMAKKQNKVSLREYADKHNPRLNRRGKKMSWGYLYRLIRLAEKKENKEPLWFDYELEGEQARVWIKI